MQKFIISKNDYLKQDINAYYHTSYTKMGNPGNPNYLNELKNTYGKPDDSDNKEWAKREQKKLDNATIELKKVLKEDLPKIAKELKTSSLSVCVVPRSKAESSYKKNQLLFKSSIQSVVNELEGFENATNCIIRTKNTKTTHLTEFTPNYNNDGEMPFVGITKKTCTINENIKSKDVLLIDDIYTNSINIDEDVIQALLDKGAKSVTFYAVGHTI